MTIIHYGNQDYATGRHFSDAAGRNASSTTVIWASPRGAHPNVDRLANVDRYFWIESGPASYPSRSHSTDALTVGYLIDVHMHFEISRRQAQLFDVVFVAQSDYIPLLRDDHPDVRWLPLAAPLSFTQIDDDRDFDLSFVGHAPAGSPREVLLRRLRTRFKMNDWRRFYSVPEMGRIYGRSKAVINPPINADLNMRFFEAMACGAAVISPPLGNGLHQLARPGEHYVETTFEPPALEQSISQLLTSGDWATIGEAGRRHIRENHTYDHRLTTVLEVDVTHPRSAPIRSMTPRARGACLAAISAGLSDRSIAIGPALHDWQSLVGVLAVSSGHAYQRAKGRLGRTRRT